jgi:hypothetical protein
VEHGKGNKHGEQRDIEGDQCTWLTVSSKLEYGKGDKHGENSETAREISAVDGGQYRGVHLLTVFKKISFVGDSMFGEEVVAKAGSMILYSAQTSSTSCQYLNSTPIEKQR